MYQTSVSVPEPPGHTRQHRVVQCRWGGSAREEHQKVSVSVLHEPLEVRGLGEDACPSCETLSKTYEAVEHYLLLERANPGWRSRSSENCSGEWSSQVEKTIARAVGVYLLAGLTEQWWDSEEEHSISSDVTRLFKELFPRSDQQA